MAFSEDIKKEFIEEIPHKTCCRRALAYGLLFDSEFDGVTLSFEVSDADFADFCVKLFELSALSPLLFLAHFAEDPPGICENKFPLKHFYTLPQRVERGLFIEF